MRAGCRLQLTAVWRFRPVAAAGCGRSRVPKDCPTITAGSQAQSACVIHHNAVRACAMHRQRERKSAALRRTRGGRKIAHATRLALPPPRANVSPAPLLFAERMTADQTLTRKAVVAKQAAHAITPAAARCRRKFLRYFP